MLCLLATACCSCAARRPHDVVESRLREQNQLLADTESKLSKTENELAIARRESNTLRQQLTADGKSPILPEQADALFRATGIKVNELLTGSLDQDDQPGEELLNVVLVPHDSDGEPIKLPGEVQIELFDLGQPGEQKNIGTWTYDIAESREHWHAGFLSSGYLFRLPWQQPPRSPQVVLHARLKTADGRQFDTSATIDVAAPVQRTDLAADDSFVFEPAGENTDSSTAFRPVGADAQPRRFPLPRRQGNSDADPVAPLRTSDSWTVDSIPRIH